MVEQATDAAEACKKHGGLSHSLGHSTNLCNLAAGGGMFASVKQYINDGGSNNRKARGHRRWCLNPPMGKNRFRGGRSVFRDDIDGLVGWKKTQRQLGVSGKRFFPQRIPARQCLVTVSDGKSTFHSGHQGGGLQAAKTPTKKILKQRRNTPEKLFPWSSFPPTRTQLTSNPNRNPSQAGGSTGCA